LIVQIALGFFQLARNEVRRALRRSLPRALILGEQHRGELITNSLRLSRVRPCNTHGEAGYACGLTGLPLGTIRVGDLVQISYDCLQLHRISDFVDHLIGVLAAAGKP